MATEVQVSAHPWIDSWNIVIGNPQAQLTWTPNAVPIIYRGNDGVHAENYSLLMNHAAAAYQNALEWQATGNAAYADEAVKILNAWGSTLTALGGVPLVPSDGTVAVIFVAETTVNNVLAPLKRT